MAIASSGSFWNISLWSAEHSAVGVNCSCLCFIGFDSIVLNCVSPATRRSFRVGRDSSAMVDPLKFTTFFFVPFSSCRFPAADVNCSCLCFISFDSIVLNCVSPETGRSFRVGSDGLAMVDPLTFTAVCFSSYTKITTGRSNTILVCHSGLFCWPSELLLHCLYVGICSVGV